MAAKKSKSSAAKAKVFTLHAKLIALAAQRGGDPSLNPALAEAIAKAKKDNVPNDNIDRAVKKGSGAGGGEGVSEIIYEGYAPGGVACVVRCLTDNRNRTASNIRHIFSHHGGSLAENGAVTSFAFENVWKIELAETSLATEKVEEAIINAGADDYELFEGTYIVWTSRSGLAQVAEALQGAGLAVESSKLSYRPKLWNEVTDFDNALALYTLEEELDNDEDVEEIWHNGDIADDLSAAVHEKMENARFRT